MKSVPSLKNGEDPRYKLPFREGVNNKMVPLSLEQLIEKLRDFNLQIDFNEIIVPYRKADELYECSDRRLKFQEINFVIKGSIFGSVNGDKIVCKPGDVLWMQPGTPHSLSWPEELIYYSFSFEIKDREENSYTIDQPYLYLHNAIPLQSIAASIAWCLRHSVGYKEERIQANLLLLCIQLDLLNGENKSERQEGCLTEFQQAKLYNYVQDHIHEPIIPSDLSLLLDYSHHYFARLFKNAFQLSAREWILRQKIRQAASELLSTERSIGRIAESLGFSDAYFFSRQFKKVMGHSPKKYRERCRVYL
jgi:AraC-like DNA-binding protein